jgi:hypothetical protein
MCVMKCSSTVPIAPASYSTCPWLNSRFGDRIWAQGFLVFHISSKKMWEFQHGFVFFSHPLQFLIH